jgi:hypothetical protein
MNTEKLYDTLTFMVQLDSQLRLQSTLETIKDMLNNLVSQPAQPQIQSSLGAALTELATAASKLAMAISPSQLAKIVEMGGDEFFNPSIAENVQAKISANAMTPAVARDYISSLVSRRALFMATLNRTIEGLRTLNVRESPIEAGKADFAFLIPCELFGSSLRNFAKELTFINRLVEHVHEGLTGQPEPATLRTLSSSTPTVVLQTTVQAVAAIATIISTFLATWERILKFRKLREELVEIGMKGKAVEELAEQVTTIIEETVEESTKLVLANYGSPDGGRKNELQNAIRTDIRRLYGQIERGLTVEFRAEPEDANESDKEALQTIVDLGNQMKFSGAANEPLLLLSGEILEGEICRKVTKKTTTQKTPKPSS